MKVRFEKTRVYNSELHNLISKVINELKHPLELCNNMDSCRQFLELTFKGNDIVCGFGGHHFWVKSKNNLDVNLLTIYFTHETPEKMYCIDTGSGFNLIQGKLKLVDFDRFVLIDKDEMESDIYVDDIKTHATFNDYKHQNITLTENSETVSIMNNKGQRVTVCFIDEANCVDIVYHDAKMKNECNNPEFKLFGHDQGTTPFMGKITLASIQLDE